MPFNGRSKCCERGKGVPFPCSYTDFRAAYNQRKKHTISNAHYVLVYVCDGWYFTKMTKPCRVMNKSAPKM